MTIASALLRRVAAAALLLTMAVGPLSTLSAEAAGSVNWKATVGVQAANMAIQSNFFFPGDITIDSGDSITWTMKSGEFHTVSFLSGMTPPPFVTSSGINPLALFPQGGDTYAGKGLVSSGLMSVAAPTTYKLTFTTPGTYQYNCLVHVPMKGKVTVQPKGTRYPHSQTYYDARAAAAEVASIGQGYRLIALGLADALSAGVGNVTAGIGRFYTNGSVAIVGFLPKVDVVHVNQTVKWTNRDPEFPHTVTFNLTDFDAGNPLLAFVPIGAVDGHATISSTTQDVNSGVLVDGQATRFTATFTNPGVYNYYCALHDELGMKGTVVVLP